jgi:LmbE family N-acetylglucosaminyl deacetylase
MVDLSRFRSTLVIAPHPDDEVLGAGGTIARLAANGCTVKVVVVTRARTEPGEVSSEVYEEASAVHRILGVDETIFWDFPTAELDAVAHRRLNAALADVVARAAPDALFVPFVGDVHLDHAAVFRSTLVAARPAQPLYPRFILAYECLSETNWNAPYLAPNFAPNLFIDIADFLPTKLAAMEAYASQNRAFPHERSLHTIEALARLRGSTVHRQAAEAFVVLREVV